MSYSQLVRKAKIKGSTHQVMLMTENESITDNCYYVCSMYRGGDHNTVIEYLSALNNREFGNALVKSKAVGDLVSDHPDRVYFKVLERFPKQGG